MADDLANSLPLPQRLAASYAPRDVRGPISVLLAFDARLGLAVRHASEPLIGQMRLAWWNEQLRLEAERRERSDPLVVALDELAGMRRSLHGLIEGWELLLAERLNPAQIEEFAASRANAFAALAGLVAAPDPEASVVRAARRWALADLASGLSSPDERGAAMGLAGDLATVPVPLSRQLRPLAVLAGLARRSIGRGGAPLLEGPGSLALAMRLGLLGR